VFEPMGFESKLTLILFDQSTLPGSVFFVSQLHVKERGRLYLVYF